MVDYKKIEVVRGGSEDNDFSPRYIIIDKETGEVLDDAQGYGYKTKRNAYACYGYKNRDKSKDHEPLSTAWRVAFYDEFDTYYHTSGATGEPKELKQLVDRLKSL